MKRAAVLATALLVSACGFHPLYADHGNDKLDPALASVEVSQIFGAMLEPSIVVDVSFGDFVPPRPPPLPTKG